MLWHSASRVCVAAWFRGDHPSWPDKSSCWKSASSLCPTDILDHWIPCISSSFSNIPGEAFTWGVAFAATTQAILTPLVMVTGAAVRFLTMTATHLLPCLSWYTYSWHSGCEASRVHLHPPGSVSSHACCCQKAWSLFGCLLSLTEKGQPLHSLSFWQPYSSQLGPWFDMQSTHSQRRVLLNDMPTNGIFSTHSMKPTTHLSHSP